MTVKFRCFSVVASVQLLLLRVVASVQLLLLRKEGIRRSRICNYTLVSVVIEYDNGDMAIYILNITLLHAILLGLYIMKLKTIKFQDSLDCLYI